MCCSVLQCVAMCCSSFGSTPDELSPKSLCCSVVVVCCSVLQRVAVCYSALQCFAVRCSALQWLQCVAVRCSALQCAAVCCSVLQYVAVRLALVAAPTKTSQQSVTAIFPMQRCNISNVSCVYSDAL